MHWYPMKNVHLSSYSNLHGFQQEPSQLEQIQLHLQYTEVLLHPVGKITTSNLI